VFPVLDCLVDDLKDGSCFDTLTEISSTLIGARATDESSQLSCLVLNEDSDSD
jgi:hypothetical protein